MSPGTKVYKMSSPSGWPPRLTDRHIIVADEDRAAVAFIVKTLRAEGHVVFHAYDALSAVQLALQLPSIDLVITNTKVEGMDGVGLILRLRKDRPELPILYLANHGRSTPELEAMLPPDVPIVREPFTAEKLRDAVTKMVDGKPSRKKPEPGD
jgi:two-component system cell cycle response regulator CpdR